jgi:hypothetical protein
MEFLMHLTQLLTHGELLSLRPNVVATVLDDGAVLLDLETKYFFALNATGWALVQLFEGGASIGDAHAFATAAGAPSDTGVDEFMSRLCDYGLFEPAICQSPLPVPPPSIGAAWRVPTVERQAEPLQSVIVSAFDPSIPLAE